MNIVGKVTLRNHLAAVYSEDSAHILLVEVEIATEGLDENYILDVG